MNDVAVIGGGLSGLAAADILFRAGIPTTVYESRIRFGGRVLSRPALGGTARYDLGPSWIWPHNDRIIALAERFGLPMFEQHTDGNLVFQDATGAVRRDLHMATMGGALRVVGGAQAMTDAVRSALPNGAIKMNTRILSVRDMGDHIDVAGQSGSHSFHERFSAVIFAMPPRVIARDITLGWNGGQHLAAHLASIPTWMAGHAKLVAVYDTPFWRGLGLNGDAISHAGPLTEIHDASPYDASQGALFGFMTPVPGWTELQVKQVALAQLATLFGEDATRPRDLLFQDWSIDGDTATQTDATPLAAHPTYGLPPELAPLIPPRVQFAGTEAARTDGGFLEGALEAAEAATQAILDQLAPSYGWS